MSDKWIWIETDEKGRVESGCVVGYESDAQLEMIRRNGGIIVPGPVVLGHPLTEHQLEHKIELFRHFHPVESYAQRFGLKVTRSFRVEVPDQHNMDVVLKEIQLSCPRPVSFHVDRGARIIEVRV